MSNIVLYSDVTVRYTLTYLLTETIVLLVQFKEKF